MFEVCLTVPTTPQVTLACRALPGLWGTRGNQAWTASLDRQGRGVTQVSIRTMTRAGAISGDNILVSSLVRSPQRRNPILCG